MFVLVDRYLSNYCRSLLQVVGDLLVFIAYADDYISLGPQVLVGTLHDGVRLMTLSFDVYQLVIHGVEFSGSVDKLFAETFFVAFS